MKYQNRSSKTGLVWDLPTRLFHWILVILVAIAWITGEGEETSFVFHKIAGYAILVALLFRIMWGFIGSQYSRFQNFLRPWRDVRHHVRLLLAFRPQKSVGHNPLGGWMILLLLGTLLALLMTGIFGAEDELAGPLAGLIANGLAHALAELHEALAIFLLVLIGMHVAGVLVESWLTKDNLIRAMLTGHKASPQTEINDKYAFYGLYSRAAIALGLATAITWLLVT